MFKFSSHTQQKKFQQGISILLVVLISAVVIAAGLAVATILIIEFRTSILAGDSITAIYAAESGVECKLFQIRRGSGPCVAAQGAYDVISLSSVAASSSVTYTIAGATTTITSIGTFGRARRALETTF